MNNQNEYVTICITDENKVFLGFAYVPKDKSSDCITTIPSLPIQIGYEAVWNGTSWDTRPSEQGIAAKWEEVKQTRNEKLAATDWTQVADVVLTEEKRAAVNQYRQMLRDITQTYRNPFEVEFPASPL